VIWSGSCTKLSVGKFAHFEPSASFSALIQIIVLPWRSAPAARSATAAGYGEHSIPKRIERLSDLEVLVIRPVDDATKEKCETEGHAPMTPIMKWSLIVLRADLIIIALMGFYRPLQLAKMIG
jgi:hypothetical protein